MRPWIPAVLLLACADPADLPGDALAVPQLLLDAPATMIAGETIAVIASGTIAEGEEILVYASAQGPGAGPCYA